MAVVPRPRLWPPTDLRLSLIETAMAKVKRSEHVHHIGLSGANGNLEVETYKEELTEERAREKCMFMNSLGLVSPGLVPAIRDVMASKQRSRLRPRKPRLPSPELPSNAVKSPLPIGNPVNTGLIKKPEEVIQDDAACLKKKVTTKPKDVQRAVSQPVSQNSCGASKENLDVDKACKEKLKNDRAQGKCVFMNSLGLVRTDIVPVIQELMASRQRSRLRPRKPRVPSPQLPSKAVKAPLPTGNPLNTGLPKKPEEVIQDDAANLEKKVTTKPKDVQRGVPQSDRSTRSKAVKRAAATPSVGETSQSLKTGDIVAPPAKRRARATAETVQVWSVHPKEPVDPTDVLVCNPTPLDRAKRQRRRPSKLLDSDFVFDFLQPAGGATPGVTTAEGNMDIRSPRSVSPA